MLLRCQGWNKVSVTIPELTADALHYALGCFLLGTCTGMRRGQNDTGTQSASTSGKQDTTAPHWREAFHLCVGNMDQILEIAIAHASGAGMLLHYPGLLHLFRCLCSQMACMKLALPGLVRGWCHTGPSALNFLRKQIIWQGSSFAWNAL